MAAVKIGVAGPVGCGKTALIEILTRKMASDYSIGVITNDIYTKEDAQFLAKNSVISPERITGVETGGCPHTAIREDASMNLEAVDDLLEKFPDIQLLFIPALRRFFRFHSAPFTPPAVSVWPPVLPGLFLSVYPSRRNRHSSGCPPRTDRRKRRG